ncbi:hypothetical protein ACFLR1_04055 [Bacteroidota bacterium]
MKITPIDWHPATYDEWIEWKRIVKEGAKIVKDATKYLDQLEGRNKYLNYNTKERGWSCNCAIENNPCRLPYFRDLLVYIPFFLLNDYSMPQPEIILPLGIDHQNSNVTIRVRNVPTELLGFYSRIILGYGRPTPAIYLSPEAIMHVANNGLMPEVLFAKVVIHELAHAYLDNLDNDGYGSHDDFYLWMEESLANYLTLLAMDLHSKKMGNTNCINQTREFIRTQPANYAFAAELYTHEFTGVFGQWRENKHVINAKGIEKNDWLQYVRNNFGSTSKPDLERLYANLFR